MKAFLNRIYDRVTDPFWYARRRAKILWRWVKFGWTAYDFDYHYALDAFTLQLSALADFMESDQSYSLDSREEAARLRETIAELRQVYEDEYALAYFDRLDEKWGKTGFEFVPTGQEILNPITGKIEGTSTMERTFERPMTPSDLAEYKSDHERWMAEAQAIQNEREDLVWQQIRQRIRHWWD